VRILRPLSLAFRLVTGVIMCVATLTGLGALTVNLGRARGRGPAATPPPGGAAPEPLPPGGGGPPAAGTPPAGGATPGQGAPAEVPAGASESGSPG
jgi:hypothetical protein